VELVGLLLHLVSCSDMAVVVWRCCDTLDTTVDGSLGHFVFITAGGGRTSIPSLTCQALKFSLFLR